MGKRPSEMQLIRLQRIARTMSMSGASLEEIASRVERSKKTVGQWAKEGFPKLPPSNDDIYDYLITKSLDCFDETSKEGQHSIAVQYVQCLCKLIRDRESYVSGTLGVNEGITVKPEKDVSAMTEEELDVELQRLLSKE